MATRIVAVVADWKGGVSMGKTLASPEDFATGVRDGSDGFPIVGIGASAGGLAAFKELFARLPNDTGMAFVLIQHLDPTRASFLSETLGRATKMPVMEAESGLLLEPNKVYVTPSNADVGIEAGRFELFVRDQTHARGSHLPIDFFFRALAKDRRTHAIGVILSGTASDGTEGLRAIKADDGITLAQDPQSAKYGGMPRSAVHAGVVDHCLSLPELADELVRLSQHPYVAATAAKAETDSPTNDEILADILSLLRSVVGVDFSEYKRPTLRRRTERRMALAGALDLAAYRLALQDNGDEVRALYEDLLIHVTAFFRDPEMFESLKTRVLPEILGARVRRDPIRIWVAGCSTGEEVYSLAIALQEYMHDVSDKRAIQIFGSDISDRVIDRARMGVFPESAMNSVSEHRRAEHFTKVENGYRINKSIRDACVFVRHDVTRDPPFSKLDLISCRNLLIYFDLALQKRVIPTLHYCLRQPGFLLLGLSEAAAGFSKMFSPIDKVNKIFARTALASTLHFLRQPEMVRANDASPQRGLTDRPESTVNLARHVDRLMLARYAPPGLLVTEKLEILQFRGETGAYLQPAQGEPQSDLMSMARHGLLAPLRAAIRRAKREMAPASESAEIESDGTKRACSVVVVPFLAQPGSKERLFLVLFEDKPLGEDPAKAGRRKGARPKGSTTSAARDARWGSKLEHELAATREYLRSLTVEHNRATDDLGAANEELVSGNEELQSMNEELETAKEELQSTNEELTTVNDELHSRNHEVSLANSDLINLLSTVDIPLLILDRERRIRRFTPKARSIINVVTGDIGRPFEDIRSNLAVTDLDAQITECIHRVELKEAEVQDRMGRWHRLQIRPYRAADGRVDGAILSLVDIDTLKSAILQAEKAKRQAERASRAKDEFLATLSHELRTPLTSMLLQSQMLRRGRLEGTKLDRAIEAIERGTLLQVQLIDDLLDVSRIVTGKMELALQSVDLSRVVKTACDSILAQTTRKNLKLTVTCDEAMSTIKGNYTRLQQVVSNLLANAIKFTPEGGEVTVAVEQVGGQAILRVSDNGRGIENAFLPHIFQRFSQEDSSVTRTHGGLGLGLAIVHHLVELHGGTVRAESAGPGKGAAFFVTLPLEQAWRAQPVADPNGEPTDVVLSQSSLPKDPTVNLGGLRDLRVLVVDDDSETRLAVASMLEGDGATVRVAESAAEGLIAVEDFRPAVVLCDIAMPGEDGYTFIGRMRALGLGRGGEVPALALTALASEADRGRALSAGYQMHVAKPIDGLVLTKAVAELSHAPPPLMPPPPPTTTLRYRHT